MRVNKNIKNEYKYSNVKITAQGYKKRRSTLKM